MGNIQPGAKAQIAMLLALKQAQETFVEQLSASITPASHSSRSSKKDARLLLRDHQDRVVRIAEFFFVTGAIAPLTSERVEAIAREHNARLQRKIAASEDPWISSRLQKGVFSASAIRMLGVNNATGGSRISLSQSDLARFFCENMSDELTRGIVNVLIDSSLLISSSAWYNAKLISSSGILEDCYAEFLNHLTQAARSGLSDEPELVPERSERLSTDPVFSVLTPLHTDDIPLSQRKSRGQELDIYGGTHTRGDRSP